jgi:flavin reductase (DIM6/NTAB) family NADH-FMN oxidoreductase RutF/DNA-binding IclR family transcriptional regulator
MTSPATVAQFDSRWFRQVLGHYPTGVAVVTAAGQDGPAGMAVGSFTSVSLDPPLIAFLPDRGSSSYPKIRQAGSFCVNVLSAEQEAVCRAFAAKGADKFAGLSWRPASSGAPVIEGAVAWIDCDFDAEYEAGDHYIVLGRVRELHVASATLPLLFFQGGYGRFAPLTLTAAAEPDLIEKLRLVDVARPQMERVAADLEVEALASALVGDEMVIVASTGNPQSRLVPTRVGQRIPFVPPLGALFVAWAGEAAVATWLARLGPDLAPQELERHRQVVERVRARGWSIGLGSATHGELEAALARTSVQRPTPEQIDAVRRSVDKLGGEYEPEDLTPEGSYQVRNVNVPVYGPGGVVVLLLSVYGLPETSTGADVDRYRSRLLAAAETVTASIGGQPPA